MYKKDLKTALSTKIAALLRIKIMKGIYSQGEHMNEVKIANGYEVSRGPIREALNILENEGFVSTPKNGRTIAVAFKQKDFIDHHEIRFFIESEALKKVILNAGDDKEYNAWLEKIEKYIHVMGKSLGVFSEEDFNNNDYLFHKSFMGKSENRIAMKVWDSLSGIRDGIMIVNKHYLAGSSVIDIIYGPHKGMFEGLKERNVKKAIENCRIHMDNSIKIYADAYK